jgi:hypothetical protein
MSWKVREGSGRGIIWGTAAVFSWSDCRMPRKASRFEFGTSRKRSRSCSLGRIQFQFPSGRYIRAHEMKWSCVLTLLDCVMGEKLWRRNYQNSWGSNLGRNYPGFTGFVVFLRPSWLVPGSDLRLGGCTILYQRSCPLCKTTSFCSRQYFARIKFAAILNRDSLLSTVWYSIHLFLLILIDWYWVSFLLLFELPPPGASCE